MNLPFLSRRSFFSASAAAAAATGAVGLAAESDPAPQSSTKETAPINVLLAGEQWTIVSFEIKGFDYFGGHSYGEGGKWLVEGLESAGRHVTYLRTCDAPKSFPETLEELARYQVVILSDIGTNSLLFHPEVVDQSKRHPNRLKLIREYVNQGGGLLMIGGWMSFQGMDGRARYRGTPVRGVPARVVRAVPTTASRSRRVSRRACSRRRIPCFRGSTPPGRSSWDTTGRR